MVRRLSSPAPISLSRISINPPDQGPAEPEREPLISSPASSSSSSSPRAPPRQTAAGAAGSTQQFAVKSPPRSPGSSSSDSLLGTHRDPSLASVMEKVKTSKLAYYLDKIAVQSEPGLTSTQLLLTNHDLKPVEKERRQWRSWNFVGFWVGMYHHLFPLSCPASQNASLLTRQLADSFNINTWMIASSTITSGCSWWQAWLCVWIGYAIAACFICATGRIGATYHIGFPVVNRASFGIWGSLWPVFNRAAMACIWYGVQAWIGGECVQLMIRAIWNNWREVRRRANLRS